LSFLIVHRLKLRFRQKDLLTFFRLLPRFPAANVSLKMNRKTIPPFPAGPRGGNVILVTGSSGLIGSALATFLETRNFTVRRLDLRGTGDGFGDVRDRKKLAEAVTGASGVVHLAAVSRVITGEQNPALCRETNIGGVENLLDGVLRQPSAARPWVVFASSREIYGQQEKLPVSEDATPAPANVYAQTKVDGERLVSAAGLRTAIVRFSNVYGSSIDHADRVVPAFCRAAVTGKELRVDGAENTFDFTHIDDVIRGIGAVVAQFVTGVTTLPPVHFVSGVPTTLGELAAAAIRIAREFTGTNVNTGAAIRNAPPRAYDVARFYGNPARAKTLLGWKAEVSLETGLRRLITDFHEQENILNEHENGNANAAAGDLRKKGGAA
jgi:nucleoside-diphosphate-sugar epimerase